MYMNEISLFGEIFFVVGHRLCLGIFGGNNLQQRALLSKMIVQIKMHYKTGLLNFVEIYPEKHIVYILVFPQDQKIEYDL